MNKRAAAAAAAILLVASLASCGRSGGKETTTEPTIPPFTGSLTTTAPQVQVTQPQKPTAATPVTYVLTTNSDLTMAPVSTTAFSVDLQQGSASNPTSPNFIIPSDFNNPGMTKPVVIESKLPSVSAPNVTNENGETEEETVTEALVKDKQGVEICADGVNNETGDYVIDISPEGWAGGIRSKSMNITVDIDGKKYTVKASTDGKVDEAGNVQIKVKTGPLNPNPGSTVTCDFPEGFVISKNGTQMSYDFSISYVAELPDTDEEEDAADAGAADSDGVTNANEDEDVTYDDSYDKNFTNNAE